MFVRAQLSRALHSDVEAWYERRQAQPIGDADAEIQDSYGTDSRRESPGPILDLGLWSRPRHLERRPQLRDGVVRNLPAAFAGATFHPLARAVPNLQDGPEESRDRSCNGARTGPRGGRWTGNRGRAEYDGRRAPRRRPRTRRRSDQDRATRTPLPRRGQGHQGARRGPWDASVHPGRIGCLNRPAPRRASRPLLVRRRSRGGIAPRRGVAATR